MIVVLGGLIFGVLMIGFSLIGAVPLLFACLGYAVFREQRQRNARAALLETQTTAIPATSMEPSLAAASTGAGSAVPEAEGEAEREPERPRTMAAGRRPPRR